MSGARRAFAVAPAGVPILFDELKRLLPGGFVATNADDGTTDLAGNGGLLRIRERAGDADLAIAPPLHPAFARAELTEWGSAQASDARALADIVAAEIVDALDDPATPPALHVWSEAHIDRDQGVSDSKALEKSLRRVLGGRVRSRIAADVGDEVIDVVVIEPGPAGPRCVYGAHVRTREMSAFPGGQRRLKARDELPSRAHLKIEEGLEWSALPLAAGDVAIDLGCSPGGWSAILLERGLLVHGVDPTPVAPAVAAHARFVSHAIPAGKLELERPEDVRWLFCDMNGPPRDALAQVLRLLPRLPRVEGIFHTIKLSDDPPLASLAHVRERLARAGFDDVRVRHLYHNRDELTVVARRPRPD